jgi:ABC transporter substrate binding protein
MQRRTFIGGSAAILASPLCVFDAAAEQPKPMPVIGFLSSTWLGPVAPHVAGFRQGLSETGYDEGQNVAIEYRWAEGHYDRLPALATDLASRKVDVIVTSGTPGIQAAKSATSSIPIIFFGGGDLVAAGLIASLARPGGNLTGISIMGVELDPKRLDLLSELVPQAGLMALLVNPASPEAEPMTRDVQEVARLWPVSTRGVAPAREPRPAGQAHAPRRAIGCRKLRVLLTRLVPGEIRSSPNEAHPACGPGLGMAPRRGPGRIATDQRATRGRPGPWPLRGEFR